MYKTANARLSVFLYLSGIVFLALPFITSCGKSSTTGPSSNIQYQVINLSPDLGSVDLYIHYVKFNKYSYFYPSASGYFYLSSTELPFQIRPGTSITPGTVAPSYNIFELNDTLKANTRYTLMVIGFKGDSLQADSLDKIFTVDTTPVKPALGHGELRFINASPRSSGLDLSANGYINATFSNVPFKKITSYVELPAGTYSLQIFPHGSSTALQDPKLVTIQDGRLYTLYSYGITGNTDSLAFGTGVITNK
jgi:hypothetical protein